MTLSAQTQREAYRKVKPDLPKQEEYVFSLFANHPDGATRQEISNLYNYSINKVAGRCNSLVKKGLLLEVGKKYVNNYPQTILKVKPKQGELF